MWTGLISNHSFIDSIFCWSADSFYRSKSRGSPFRSKSRASPCIYEKLDGHLLYKWIHYKFNVTAQISKNRNGRTQNVKNGNASLNTGICKYTIQHEISSTLHILCGMCVCVCIYIYIYIYTYVYIYIYIYACMCIYGGDITTRCVYIIS